LETVRDPSLSSGDQPADKNTQANERASRHPLFIWFFANARWIWPLIVVAAVFAVSWTDLRSIHLSEVRNALHSQDPRWLLPAVIFTLINLAVMGLYDVICLKDAPVSARNRWWTGTLAFAWSNFLTLGPLAGPAIRFWLYRPAGVNFGLLRQAILSIAVGFGAGLFFWLGIGGIPLPFAGVTALSIRLVAVLALAYILGRLAHSAQHWKIFPRWVREMKVRWVPLFLLGALDWFLAFLVFAAVARSGGIFISFEPAARLFFFGQGIGLISLIPGGLGSADAFWISQLDSTAGKAAAALVIYRTLYYLLPWCAATVLLLRRAVHQKVRWAGPARYLVAVIVVLSGCVMLVSSATPALTVRMRVLEKIIPLPVLETSHLASAIVGLLLLLIARGLAKGYRYAFRTTLGLLLTGAAFNILKGLDYEEAIVLLLTAVLLWTHSKLFTLPSHTGGTIATVLTPVAIAILTFTAVGYASYGTTGYSSSLWLTFAHHAEAARFLRALSVLTLLGLILAIYLYARIPHRYIPPSRKEIERALKIHWSVGKGTNALMMVNGDKSIHFWEERGFCLYRAMGGNIFVFSDPAVPEGMERPFLNSLLQTASELDRSLAFYQISSRWIPILHDYGYSFFKLGEEAIVELGRFNIQGNKGKAMRNVLNRFRNDGYVFEVLAAEEVHMHLAELRRVSDAWLRSKRTREKQFSIGFFDEHYLCGFPCATVRDKDGVAVAFSNVLCDVSKEEFSVDLMRFVPGCPNGVMDLLFLKLFEWGKSQGFRTFNLGMAPLASVGEVPQARMQERLAKVLFQYGEHWYNFRGLRQFKEKYDPVWVPRYLAYPAFWRWPQALANSAALIAGGWINLFFPPGGTADEKIPPARAA
jgi:phosphatidylglycerol lysyltransferase